MINKYTTSVTDQIFNVNCLNQNDIEILEIPPEVSVLFCFFMIVIHHFCSFFFQVPGGHLSQRRGRTLHHSAVHAAALRGHHVGRHVQRKALHPTRCGRPLLHRSGWNVFWVSGAVLPAAWLSRRFAFDSLRAAGALLHPLMVKRVQLRLAQRPLLQCHWALWRSVKAKWGMMRRASGKWLHR